MLASRPRFRAIRVGILVGGCLALLLNACASSNFQYVRESQTNLIFKLPEDWRRFDQDEVLNTAGLTGEEQQTQSIVWAVGFEDGRGPDDFNSLFSSDVPVGLASIRVLTDPQERSQFSLNSLRNEMLPIDLLQQQGVQIEVLSQEEVDIQGLHGIRAVFNFHPVGSEASTFNKTALVDPRTTTVFLLFIGCNSDCYEQNQDVIDEIVSSYTIGGMPNG